MTPPPDARIAAVVLAAGRSQRMGQPKMLLPWGGTTVIGQVVLTLIQAGLDEIVVVTGGARHGVEAALQGQPVRLVYNSRYEEDQMACSLKAGLVSLPPETDAAIVALGDQPQIQPGIVRQVLQAYHESRSSLVFPSYRMQRGHPWVVARSLWGELVDIEPPKNLRNFVQQNTDQIQYVIVQNDSILRDLDTPADYQRERPVDPNCGEDVNFANFSGMIDS
jgi:molybdenum cofactor cytidylyltransferase